MRKLIYLITLVVFILGSCVDGESKKEGRFCYHKFSYVPIEQILTLEFVRDTYQSTQLKFGDNIFEEFHYGGYVLPRKIGTEFYPVDKIVGYLGTLSINSEYQNKQNLVRRIQTKERQNVFLFFYKDRLVDYSVFNEYFISPDSPKTALGKNATIDVRKKYAQPNGRTAGGWPEAYCDDKYYFYKSGREKEHVETYLAEPCAWEAADFETKLREGHYYDRKKEMDQGDYSHLIKVQSTLPKWSECPLPEGSSCKK